MNTSFNDTVLNKINTDTAWLLGWIASDGCVMIKPAQSCMVISIIESDEDVLKQIQSIVGHVGRLYYRAPSPTGFENGKPSVVLNLSSRIFCDALGTFDIHPRKSGKQPFPNRLKTEGEDIKRAFIRGYFEGNGSISLTASGQPKVSFCGSAAMMETISEIIVVYCHIRKKKPYEHSRSDKVHCLDYKCHSAMAVAEWMYRDATRFCRRKKNKYAEIKKLSADRFEHSHWMGEAIDGARPLNQFDVSGRRIKTWPSISSAATALKTTSQVIRRAAEGKRKTALGFEWAYA